MPLPLPCYLSISPSAQVPTWKSGSLSAARDSEGAVDTCTSSHTNRHTQLFPGIKLQNSSKQTKISKLTQKCGNTEIMTLKLHLNWSFYVIMTIISCIFLVWFHHLHLSQRLLVWLHCQSVQSLLEATFPSLKEDSGANKDVANEVTIILGFALPVWLDSPPASLPSKQTNILTFFFVTHNATPLYNQAKLFKIKAQLLEVIVEMVAKNNHMTFLYIEHRHFSLFFSKSGVLMKLHPSPPLSTSGPLLMLGERLRFRC